ncbi:hypothetical protein [Amycolatopsis sp. NPDC051071]|uniref:hypothetical protein n=1 Tax=Amycolatopsis sp. NPDC051071 TaxID=3154637 RepID=UPI0034411E97
MSGKEAAAIRVDGRTLRCVDVVTAAGTAYQQVPACELVAAVQALRMAELVALPARDACETALI